MAQLMFDRPERWNVRVIVEGPAGGGQLVSQVESTTNAAMGLFGVGEILYNLEQLHGKPHVPAKVGNVWPSRKDLKQSSGAIGRGSASGPA